MNGVGAEQAASRTEKPGETAADLKPTLCIFNAAVLTAVLFFAFLASTCSTA